MQINKFLPRKKFSFVFQYELRFQFEQTYYYYSINAPAFETNQYIF